MTCKDCLMFTHCRYDLERNGEPCENFKDKSVLEKQIPKKVDEYLTSSYCCPICTNVLGRYSIYCDNCGQALDWGDTE